MNKVVGDIAVTVGADVSGLLRGMDRSRRATNKFGGDFQKTMRRVRNVASLAAVAMAGIATAGVRMQRSAASAAVEIGNLSRIAGSGTTEFQRMAAAAESVNISQEKLSDILKDVNDRVGDFVTTGGGPMKDFFEQIAPRVGVTADQFARLSGPEALQLYVSSLEKANLNQQEMTFFLEAMASDSTALLPLLRNNGAALQELGDAAERNGRVLSQDAVRAGTALDRVFKDLSGTLRTQLNEAILENSDTVENLAEDIDRIWIPAFVAVGTTIAEIVAGVGTLIEGIKSTGEAIVELFTKTENIKVDKRGKPIYDDSGGQDGEGGSLPGLSRNPFDTGRGEVVLGGGRGFGGGFGGGGGDAGGGSGDPFGDLDAIKQRYQDYATTIQEQYDEDLERLREFREARKITLEEYNDLEARLEQQRADKLRDIDQRATSERLSSVSGSLNDLAGAMRAGNKRLFEIGKAASLAEAVVNGYEAASDAWAKGMKVGGPPVAAAFTAASLARTGALVSGIQSTSIGGNGGGGGAAGGAVAAASAGPSPVSSNVAIQLVGSENATYSTDQVRDLINLINEAVEGGAMIRLV